jgi:thiol-disulfide isomerase/thioredoxin
VRLMPILLVALVVAGCDRQKAEAPQAPASTEADSGKSVDRTHKGQAAPAVTFKNPDGGDFDLSRFKGGPVLVNLWASWCAPCIKELPTLQALEQSHLEDGALAVIAVSQDMAPKGSVDAFLKDKGIGRFAAFHDPEMKLTDALGVQVMPTTILYDSAGREVWRFVGDLDWTGDEAKTLLSEAR